MRAVGGVGDGGVGDGIWEGDDVGLWYMAEGWQGNVVASRMVEQARCQMVRSLNWVRCVVCDKRR